MAGVNPHSSMLTESIRNARRSEAKELLAAFEQGSATIQLGALRDCRTWRYASLEIDFRSKKRRAQQCGSDCPTSRLTNSMTCQSTTVLALIYNAKNERKSYCCNSSNIEKCVTSIRGFGSVPVFSADMDGTTASKRAAAKVNDRTLVGMESPLCAITHFER